MVTKQTIRKRIIQIFYVILKDSLEGKYNFNPIEIIYDVVSTEADLDTERSKVNQIERLMNIFRIEKLDERMQRIYLRFLASSFWIRFTPVHSTVTKAIGELLASYHDYLMPQFEEILDSLNCLLELAPIEHALSKILYPNILQSAYSNMKYSQKQVLMFLYIKYSEIVENTSTQKDNKFNPIISVFTHLLKCLKI